MRPPVWRPTSEPTEPSIAVPPVPKPLNRAKFLADPCSAMKPDQLRVLGFVEPKREAGVTPAFCTFQTRAADSWVMASSKPPYGPSLRYLYEYHAEHGGPSNRWEELTVLGYPAVIVGAAGNPEDKSGHLLGCDLALAIDDSAPIGLSVSTNGSTTAGSWQYDPCGAVKKIAELAVVNLST